jgi:2-polyprenyl-3-methyl-5-hydroxy-6-metoxy-1,4-benzoquinol methylase
MYNRWICRREFLRQEFHGFNERAVEYAFVFKNLADIFPQSVLDVGTGVTALPQLIRACGPVVTAIDNISDYWPDGMNNRHYYVLDEDILSPKLDRKFDLITCISTLEHIEAHDAAVDSMFRLLAPGGRLVLSFPYCEDRYVANAYALPGSIGEHVYPFKTQVYSRRQVAGWLAHNNAKIVCQEYWRFFSGEFWTLGERVIPPVRVEADQLHQICCLALDRI